METAANQADSPPSESDDKSDDKSDDARSPREVAPPLEADATWRAERRSPSTERQQRSKAVPCQDLLDGEHSPSASDEETGLSDQLHAERPRSRSDSEMSDMMMQADGERWTLVDAARKCKDQSTLKLLQQIDPRNVLAAHEDVGVQGQMQCEMAARDVQSSAEAAELLLKLAQPTVARAHGAEGGEGKEEGGCEGLGQGGVKEFMEELPKSITLHAVVKALLEAFLESRTPALTLPAHAEWSSRTLEEAKISLLDELLCYAAERSHEPTIKTLLNSGADVAYRNAEGCSPIFYAAAGGHVELVELFISAGAPYTRRAPQTLPVPSPTLMAARVSRASCALSAHRVSDPLATCSSCTQAQRPRR